MVMMMKMMSDDDDDNEDDVNGDSDRGLMTLNTNIEL